MNTITGKVWVFGDFIDTDLIIPHAYLATSDPSELTKHAFESIYENFYQKVKRGDIIIAGKNFGTGSSREEAVFVLKQMGIAAVIAESFARIYYRNLINLGILAIQIENITHAVKNGDIITIDCRNGTLQNTTTSETFIFPSFPSFIVNLIEKGGTIHFLKEKLGKH
ncbi:MAG: 3-isopropylmalate dehydratase [Candidatus Lokiarchaeota archaeon]|nr:3-isopropylmalate dehydratase [Candidatus Lokiarchaeota archaeon]